MKWVRGTMAAIATLYPIALLAVAASLVFIGERWWVAGVTLYLPRIFWGAPLPFIVLGLLATGQYGLLWTQVVSALLVLFPLMGLAVRLPRFGPSSASIRVLSYNVNSSYGGADNVAQEIDRYSPDIVLLQEAWTSEGTIDHLRARYATVNVSSQFVIATRYPVLSTNEPTMIDYRGRARSPRFVQQVLDTPLGRVAVYNVHPLSPRQAFYTLRGNGLSREIPSGRFLSSANAAAFLENAGLRDLQVETAARQASRESIPVIIAGDTNLPGLSNVFHRWLSDYQDGFPHAGTGFGYTFPSNHVPWMRIDRILATRELAFVRFQVGRSRASDHLCVVADLVLRR
jgi:endonuclease/exonuclease/phosphatase family metal-dependent hydrolase